jgi:lysophospholipase L1-like esterase
MALIGDRTRRLAILCLTILLASAAAFGQVEFSRYVALGDSLTAAFISGSLHLDSQDTSYAALIHRQATGGGGFEQPLVSAPGIPPILELRSLSPLVITPSPGLGSPLNLNLPRPYDNLAVPGADVTDVLNTVTDGGGLHDLILRGLGTQLQQALALQPTFVTLWIGNNDALAAATSGIVIDGVTLTKLADFEADFTTIAGALASSSSVTGLVFATVVEVTAAPFVTTIPPVVVDPVSGEPVLVGGQLVPLIGPDGPLSLSDYVLLSASPLLAQGTGIPQALGGTGQPLPDNVVLSAAEAATIESRVDGFNGVIRSTAQQLGAAVLDVNPILDQWVDGIQIGGIELSLDFLTGGLVSYDGVHASQLGYALVANAFIETINASYGAEIPPVNVGAFLFGPDGQAPSGTGAAAGNFVLSRKAYKSLRFALDVPKPKKLRRIKKRLEAPQQP